ncbi:MAG: TIM-barrel domain-containing protein, partial [Spirochaetota bacterium]
SFDDGLATVILAAISMGFAGIGYHHSDIGGYTTLVWIKRSKELFMRWAEHAAFTQTMRSHEGNRPDVNAQFWDDAETLAHLAKMTKIFTAMKPYHIALSDEYQKTGLAPIRHPYVHFEDDEILHGLKYQYMYGPDLMVAPVIKPGKKSWKVYLPDEKWLHAWSGKEYSKGRHTVSAPIGEPPVFYRASSKFADIFKRFKDVK